MASPVVMLSLREVPGYCRTGYPRCCPCRTQFRAWAGMEVGRWPSLTDASMAGASTTSGRDERSLWQGRALPVPVASTPCGRDERSLWQGRALPVAGASTHCGRDEHSLWQVRALPGMGGWILVVPGALRGGGAGEK